MSKEQKQSAISITKRLKAEKQVSISRSELLFSNEDCLRRVKRVFTIGLENEGSESVMQQANYTIIELQVIRSDTREYMQTLDAAGLLVK